MQTFTLQIISEHLLMRPVQIEDADSVFRYRSDAEANKYQGWVPREMKDVREFIGQKIASEINLPGTWFQLAIIKRDDNELIGDVGIHFLSTDNLQLELGCTLNMAYQGKGYAIEALREIIGYLFTQLGKHRIVASIDPRNMPSIRLFERLGFRREAHFRESLFINGEWVDDMIYAVLKDEWFAGRNILPEKLIG